MTGRCIKPDPGISSSVSSPCLWSSFTLFVLSLTVLAIKEKRHLKSFPVAKEEQTPFQRLWFGFTKHCDHTAFVQKEVASEVALCSAAKNTYH